MEQRSELQVKKIAFFFRLLSWRQVTTYLSPTRARNTLGMRTTWLMLLSCSAPFLNTSHSLENIPENSSINEVSLQHWPEKIWVLILYSVSQLTFLSFFFFLWLGFFFWFIDTLGCLYNTVNFPLKSLKKDVHCPLVRVRYGVSFVSPKLDLCFAAVIAVLYVISWYIRPR